LDPAVIIGQNSGAVAIRDRYPVADQHTLIVPRRHVESPFDLSPPEYSALWELVAEVRRALSADAAPDAFTIGLNDGRAAGQTVMHAHVHVIPRRLGDVDDSRGGIRWVIPAKAPYWENSAQ
jgi:diadenosine tetraphosphate (Ap4A) HIT family hydrolase